MGGEEVTRAWFDAEMSRLAGLKFPPAELDTHWEALNDVPEDLLMFAIGRAQRESDDFPAPKMLRMYADQARRSTSLPVEADRSAPLDEPFDVTLPTGVTLPIKRLWKYYCETCSDSGWRSFACGAAIAAQYPWMTPSKCGRTHQDAYSHEWVDRCACEMSNPAILRRKDMAARAGRRTEAA
jgi:hypothetical protein